MMVKRNGVVQGKGRVRRLKEKWWGVEGGC